MTPASAGTTGTGHTLPPDGAGRHRPFGGCVRSRARGGRPPPCGERPAACADDDAGGATTPWRLLHRDSPPRGITGVGRRHPPGKGSGGIRPYHILPARRYRWASTVRPMCTITGAWRPGRWSQSERHRHFTSDGSLPAATPTVRRHLADVSRSAHTARNPPGTICVTRKVRNVSSGWHGVVCVSRAGTTSEADVRGRATTEPPRPTSRAGHIGGFRAGAWGERRGRGKHSPAVPAPRPYPPFGQP